MGVVVHASVQAVLEPGPCPGSLSLQLQNVELVHCPGRRNDAAPHIPGARSQPPGLLRCALPATALPFYIWRSPWHPSTHAGLPPAPAGGLQVAKNNMWLINLITTTVIERDAQALSGRCHAQALGRTTSQLLPLVSGSCLR